MQFRTITVLTVLATSVGHAAHPVPGAAQPRSASITGRVVSGSAERPLSGVGVVLVTVERSTTTDSAGRFVFSDLDSGTYRIEAVLEGAAPLVATFTLSQGERKQVDFRIDGSEARPAVAVGDSGMRPAVSIPVSAFERRRANGNGRYFDQDDIQARRPHRLMDLLRQLPGVRIDCQAGNCSVRLNNHPRGCAPAVFLDEQRSVLAALDFTAPADVLGLEIYRGPSETPPELNNDQARCGGAIAISTRRG